MPGEVIGLSAIMDLKAWDSATKRYSSDVSKMTKETDKGSSLMGKALGGIGTAAAAAAATGVAALTAGIIGLTGTIVTGVGKAADLEQQMANVAAVMQLTRDEAAPLKALVSELSLNPNLKVDATEAATAIELLARNGLSMSEIMDGAALSTVALANATGADFGTAADVATDAMLQFGLTASELGTVIDGITGVTSNSKFAIDDMRLALAQAGGVAGEIGVSFEDFATVIAGISSNFASGSDAGTSFKTMLARLSNPTKEVQQTMDALGISLFDSNGNMRDMSEVVGQLNGAFSGMTEAQKAQTAAVLGGADASRVVLALAGLTEEQFVALSEKVNTSGQAFNAAATRMDTFQGSLEILKGIVDAVLIAIGDEFLPVLTELTRESATFAEGAAPKVIGAFGMMADQTAVAIAAVREFIPVLADFAAGAVETGSQVVAIFNEGGIGAVMSAFVATISQTLVDAWPTIQAALLTWADQLWGWLETAIPAGQTALAGAVAMIAGTLSDAWPTIQAALLTWAGQFWDWLTTVIAEHPLRIFGLTGLIAETIINNWDVIAPALLTWANQFWDWITTTALPAGQTALTGLAVAVAGYITENWPAVQEALLTWGSQFFNWVAETAIPAGQEQLTALVDSVSQFITDSWPIVQEALATWGAEFMGAVVGPAIAGIPGALTGFTSALTTFLTDYVPTLQATMATWAPTLLDWIQEAVAGIGEALGVFGLAVATWVASEEGQGQMLALGEALGQAIVTGMGNLFDLAATGELVAIMGQLAAGLVTAVAAIAGLLIAVGAQIVAGIYAGLLESLGIDLEPALISDLGGILSGIGSNFVTIVTLLGEQLVQGIVDGISGAQAWLETALIDTITAGIDALKSLLGISSPSTLFMGFGTDLIQGLIEGIRSMISSIPAVLGEVAGAVTDAASGLLGGLFGGGEDAAAPGVDMSALQFDTGPLSGGLTDIQGLINQITTGLTTIYTATLVALQEIWIATMAALVEQLALVLAKIVENDAALVNITTVVLPNLLVQTQTTSTGMVAAFQEVINIINQAQAAIMQLIGQLQSLQSTAEEVAEAIVSAFESVIETIESVTKAVEDSAEAFEDAADAAGDLESDIKSLTSQYSKLAAAARDAASAANSVAGAAASQGLGVGAARGLGIGAAMGLGIRAAQGLGLGYTIPSGFPNDSFPIWTTSGEEAMVAPRGQSIDGIIMQRLASLISGGGAPVSAGETIIQVGPFYVSDPMTARMVGDIAAKRVAEKLGK